MCGSIKHEKVSRKMGEIFRVRDPQSRGPLTESHWSGFIRREKLDWWKSQSYLVDILIDCESFTEGKYEFYCAQLRGYIVESPVILHGKVIHPPGGFRITTREAITSFEKKIHNRWPLITWGNEPHIFTQTEIIKIHGTHQLSLL